VSVVLKPGRDKSLRARHPWIFSGAIAALPPLDNGDVLSVYSHEGEFLAKAYFHKENSISGRVLTFKDEPLLEAIRFSLQNAIRFRALLVNKRFTNCYRLVNGESDNLPGLIVDIYDDLAVMQINTCGMERLKSVITALLQELLPIRGLYEKSHSGARRAEGLPDAKGPLFGECPSDILVKENGLCFLVDIEGGQKTGFFLDQRMMRQLVRKIAKHRHVLNCFSYSGGFSIAALKGGASHVVSVDASERACRYARENTLLNHIPLDKHEVVTADVFEYLKTIDSSFNLIILDPPAFAKRRQDVTAACRGYKEINRRAFEKLPSSSYLLTSSCSHFVDENLFGQLIFQAALEAGRNVRICARHIQAPDHPVSLFHPEGHYLKSLLLYIS
jgi:23S rRNA (cytosine1962-C5)-methyltransferase